MRRVLGSLVVASLAFALTGGASVALAVSTGHGAQSTCAKATPDCHEAALTCACCFEHDGDTPVPALPSSDRTSLAKSSSASAVLLPPSVAAGCVPLARDLNARPTHRAGPPLSLSILHASLLL